MLFRSPIFSGVDPDTLNRRRGVAGFYARGSNPPPTEATVLTTLRQGEFPVDWLLGLGKGRLFVHSGNDLWTTFHEPAENARLTGNLLRWATNEENDP